MVEDKNGIRICSSLDKPHGLIDFGDMDLTGIAQTVTITVSNTLDCPVELFARTLDYQSESDLRLSEVGKAITVLGKTEHKMQATFEPTVLGQFKQVLIFKFKELSPEPKSNFYIARFLNGRGTSEEVRSILPTEKYQRPAPFTMVVDPEVEVVPGTPLLPYVYYNIIIYIFHKPVSSHF